MSYASSTSLPGTRNLWSGRSTREAATAAVPRVRRRGGTFGFFVLTMSFATLMLRAGYAVSETPASQQTPPASSAAPAKDHPGDSRHANPTDSGRSPAGGKASVEPRGHGRPSMTVHAPTRARLTPANHPQPRANNRQHLLPGNAVSLHPPASNKLTATARGGPVPYKTVNNAPASRAPSALRPNAPLLNNAPHRRPNPAVVGGSLVAHRSNTGAIDGTLMRRKP